MKTHKGTKKEKSVVLHFAFFILSALLAGVASAAVTVSFDWYRNAPVSDFPVPITLEEGIDGFTYAGFADAEHGSDLRAYGAGGVALPLEIETWSPGGKSVVWVKVPYLSNETVVTLDWGDATAEQADASGMWGEAVVVMHFGDTNDFNSAKGDAIPNQGSSTLSAKAPVGTGPVFNRTGNYSNTNATNYWNEATNVFTISFWLKTDRLTKLNDPTYLVQFGDFAYASKSAANQMAVLLNWNANAQVSMYRGSYNGSAVGPFDTPAMTFPSDGTWHHVAYTYDGSTCTAYLDGSVKGTKTFTANPLPSWELYGGYFAVAGTRDMLHPLNGAMDEVRFERTCRSAEWIRAEVETQARGYSAGTIRFSDYDGPALTDFPAYVQVDRSIGVEPATLYKDLVAGTSIIRDLRTNVALPVEIECHFDNAFDNVLGLWIKMPSYSAEDGVVISASLPHYVPDSSMGGSSTVGPDGVWDSDDYLLVFHMNPTNYLHDVKSKVRLKPNYKNNGGETANGYPAAATGPTGPYMAYHSTTNAIQSLTPTIARAITNVYTISWWMKEDADEFANPKRETYVWTVLGVSLLKGAGYSSNGTGPNKMAIWGGSTSATLEIPDTGWHQYAYANDGKKTYCYRDGVLMKTVNGGKDFALPTSISGKLIHLAGSSNATKDAFRGNLDEFRLETVCRDENWIKATYLNQQAWKEGVPWQLAPHFAENVSADADADSLTATATLSCRTNATVTFCWGRSDGGTLVGAWEGSSVLGTRADGALAGSALSLDAGVRYAVRFHAVNEFGEAWSPIHYVTTPKSFRSEKTIPIAVNYAGGETLVDFPLCVRIPASNNLPDDPAKVRLLDADGTVLPWEAETWDPAGESILWVRVPEMSGPTTLTLAFHKSFPSDDGDWNAASVWPADAYVGVWHFAPSTKSGVVTKDSSAREINIVQNTLNAYATNGVAGSAWHWPRKDAGGIMKSDDNGGAFNDFRAGFTFSFWASIPDGTNGAPLAKSHFVKHELVARTGLPSDFYNQYLIRYEGSAAKTVDFLPNNYESKLFPGYTNYLLPSGATAASANAASSPSTAPCRRSASTR